jgi:hypothetical protein
MGLASENCIFTSSSAACAGQRKGTGVEFLFQILASGGIIDRSEKVRN